MNPSWPVASPRRCRDLARIFHGRCRVRPLLVPVAAASILAQPPFDLAAVRQPRAFGASAVMVTAATAPVPADGSGHADFVCIDRLVAAVDKDILTDSELRVQARLWLAWQHGTEAAQIELSPAMWQSMRDWMVQRLLIEVQARRLGADDVAEADVEARLHALRGRFASAAAFAAFCRRFDIDAATVHDTLARDVRLERYMAQRLRTRLIGGSDDLAAERYARAAKEWMSELRRMTEVRLESSDGTLELQPPP